MTEEMHTPSELDVESAPSMALPVARQPDRLPLAMTPQQARVDAVAALTTGSLARASTLLLTPEETERLTAEFPDSDFLPGAGGKENLIYIQHSALRDRLNKVLGLGQWAIIVRETWNEDFETRGSAGKPPQKGVRVYVRGMMLVRGCYVAESVGDMDYFPGNAAQNFGDAYEGAQTAAFRRCAKNFGVGVQAWDRHWCDSWWLRKRGTAQQKPNEYAGAKPQQAVPPRTPPPTPKAMTPAERKERLLASLKGFEPEANKVFVEEGLVLETETFRDISTARIELMPPDQMLALIKTVKMRKADSDQIPDAAVPSQPHEDPRGEDAGVADPVGTVEEVNQKDGKTKAGKNWVKFGVKIDGQWLNTFSQTDYETAAQLKGRQVRYTFAETKFGKDLLTIESAEENTP